jgi:hypothetical protein
VVDPAHPGFLGITIKEVDTTLIVLINRDKSPVRAEKWKALAGLAETTNFRSLLNQENIDAAFELPGTEAVVLLAER